MTLDDRLQRAVDSLGHRLRDEIARELSTLDLAPVRDGNVIGRLADSLRAIDNANSLSEILEALATAASTESPKAGVFLVSGGTFRSFRVFGLPDDADQLRAEVKEAAVPLMVAGTQIGAVYAENADSMRMEILARFASRALEALTAIKTARAVADGEIG